MDVRRWFQSTMIMTHARKTGWASGQSGFSLLVYSATSIVGLPRGWKPPRLRTGRSFDNGSSPRLPVGRLR
jgi:hypothetical protein